MNTQQIIEQIAEAMEPDRSDKKAAVVGVLLKLAPYIPQWMDMSTPREKKGVYNVKYPSANPERFIVLPAYWDGEKWLYDFDGHTANITEHVKEYQPLPSTTHPFEQLLNNLKNNNDGTKV